MLLPSELIALAVFKERLRMLGLVAVHVDEGGSRAALFDRDGLRVRLDATPVATLSLRGEHELAAVHHALDALLADCNAPAFGVRRSGQTAKTYKRDKPRALATALRAELAAGGVVCVEPAFDKLIPRRVRLAL